MSVHTLLLIEKIVFTVLLLTLTHSLFVCIAFPFCC